MKKRYVVKVRTEKGEFYVSPTPIADEVSDRYTTEQRFAKRFTKEEAQYEAWAFTGELQTARFLRLVPIDYVYHPPAGREGWRRGKRKTRRVRGVS